MNTSSPAEIAGYYNRLNVETAPLPKKIVMLHDRAAEFVRAALEVAEGERRAFLDKAQNIISQLQSALRIRDELSHSLFYLYDFTYAMLDRADPVDVQAGAATLITLRDTFRQLLKSAL